MSCAEPIRALEEAVIAGIAAGEVVERPASIVKELIENSLDAGACRITLAYDDDCLAVTDDGAGIPAAELPLALARHATSKIRDLADLERIASFGFRGEALASIAGVSRLELLSRTREATGGSRIVAAHGRVGRTQDAAARQGTRVTISELFANVPARRKFLKSASAEYGLAADVVRRFALARPDVHFRLERGGRAAFEHAPVAGLSERLGQVYGRDVAPVMVPVEGRYRGFALRGAVSAAGSSWGSARRIALFVNGRWVHDKLLFRAVMEGYRTYLLKGRYPAAALFLDVDTRLVDVNVHPQKLEVRFSEPDVLTSFVAEAIRAALRTGAGPLGRWGLVAAVAGAASHSRPPGPGSYVGSSSTADAGAAERAPEQGERAGRTANDRLRADAALDHAESAHEDPELPGYRTASVEAVAAMARQRAAAGVAEQSELFTGADPTAEIEVIGQVFAGYIVCQHRDEVLLIDQHAAHERVLFERLMRGFAENVLECQPLVVPLTVHVGADGVDAAARFAARLVELGWDLAAFGEEDVIVRSVPSIAAGCDLVALVERLVADLLRSDADAAVSRLVEQVFATVACHAAVRVGRRLDVPSARALLREIGSVDFASSCPHGRPVARALDRSRIERMFGR